MTGVGLPNQTMLATLDSITKVREFARCPEATWNAMSTALGTVMLPASTLKATMTALRIGTGGTERPLSAMETIQVALMWRVARQAMNLPDIDPLQDPVAMTAPAVGGAPRTTPTKKSSAVLDQMDDTEIELMTRMEIDQAHIWHIEMTGAEPPEEAEPTPEQLAALRDRVVTRRECPYADFSILTPHGRTMQRQMKARSWVLQQDGTFKSLDLRILEGMLESLSVDLIHATLSFDWSWSASNCGMLGGVLRADCKAQCGVPRDMAFADEGGGQVSSRNVRTLQETTHQGWRGKSVADESGLRSPAALGGSVHLSARNKDYWEEQVTRPATIFIARGGKHMGADRAEKTHMSDAAQQALGNATDEVKETVPKKKKKAQEDAESPKRRKSTEDKWEKGDAHPKKWGKHFVSTEDGTAICFRYAKGKGGECGEPCKEGRAHVCQLCLGNHVNSFCPMKKGGKDTGKGKKPSN